MQLISIRHPQLSRTTVHMLGLRRLMTHLNTLHPRMFHHLFNTHPAPRVGLQHLSNQTPARLWGQVGNGRRALGGGGGGGGTGFGVGGVEGVGGGLGGAPGEFLEVQAVVDDSAGPDVDQPGVVWFSDKLLRRDVRLASAQP